MKTEITYRKTPHAIVNTVFGTAGVDMVYAWCFENNNIEDKLVKKLIPKSQCYVNANLQDQPDYMFKDSDMRKYHVDVWNEKAKNYDRYNKFLTNYELTMYHEKQSETARSAELLLSAFE